MERLGQDLRFGLRIFRNNPGFTAVAVLTLALGIGANTAIFSVVNGLLIKSLPFRDAKQLVWITNFETGGMSGVTSGTFNYRDLSLLNHSFSGMASYNAFFPYSTYNLTGSGTPERLQAVDISENFFQVLGIQPALGRAFVHEECLRAGRRAVILTDAFWNSKFARNPSVIGKTMNINGDPTMVVGVMPPWFDFASVFAPAAHLDMFVPLFIDQQNDRNGNLLAMIARLKPGVSLPAAQAEMNALIAQIRQHDATRNEFGAHLRSLEDQVTGSLRPALVVLGCAVGFVLLIACANLSNLLLARATSRRKEIALRIALGAGRLRLIRQMLTESIALSLIGGMLGLPLAFAGTKLLSSLQRTTLPLLGQIGIDVRALWFTLFVATLAGVVFGLVPALQASRSDVNETLKEATAGAGGGRHRDWTRNLLITAEVALALMLLGGAGLMMRSFVKLLSTDLGFRPDHVAVVRIDPVGQADEKHFLAYLSQMLDRVRAIPGVQAASITDAVPLDRDRSWNTGLIGKNYQNTPDAHVRIVGPGYFETMRIRLLKGRVFATTDTMDREKVVIVNRDLAEFLLPGQNPLGREIDAGDKARIIGVVDSVRHSSPDEPGGFEFYRCYLQGHLEGADFVIRTTQEPEAFLPALRRTVWAVSPTQPVAEFRTLDQLVDTAVSPRRFTMLLLAIFAGLALLLASLGIYGVISYAALQRTREIGIRMTLGASAAQVEWHVVREAVVLTLAGTLLGIGGLLALSRYLRSLLFEVTPNDPATLAVITLLLLLVATAASYLPARRAARIDPVAALRFE